MITVVQIIFWISVFSILHTYFLFPLLVITFSKRKKDNSITFSTEELPDISIIMAVHNEAKIIKEKILSVLECGYPLNKLDFLIGSDASDDNTDAIIEQFSKQYSNIKFTRFKTRQGKVNIINRLEEEAQTPLLVFTDANAVFSKGSLVHLVKHFKNEEIKVVGGRLLNRKLGKEGVIFQEHSFMENEFKIKLAEGRLWGCMIGAYGAFFAIRKDAFKKVPTNFLVDDFYISLKAIEKQGKAICEGKAVVYENVPGELMVEFKRKQRIATGNFQNLKVFFPMLFSKRSGLAFSFLSHKVLRWLGPVFLILIFFSSAILSTVNMLYAILFIAMSLSLLIPIIDYFHRKSRIHVVILRFITHFYYMNAALLLGLLNYLKGVKTNVWEPTKRQ